MGVHRLQAAVYHAMASSSEAAAPPAGAQAIPARPGTETELAAIRDLAITPGGMHFLGTTPGGTKIIYDQATLMHFRQSPLAKTPPANLPMIPGVTRPETEEERTKREAIDTIPEEDEADFAEPVAAKPTNDD